MKNIAIIPARAGSKGLPDKNIKKLLGKPLLAYSIEAATASGVFSEIMVSTDSEEYAGISREYGANVPFLRSRDTSTDAASSWDMVDEVLENYKKRDLYFDTFCLLQPTSPLRSAVDITNAYRLFEEKQAFSIVSMTESEHPVSWCGEIKSDLSIDGFVDPSRIGRRQEQKRTFHPNGAIYIADISEYDNDHFLYREGGYAYIMPRERSIDIDTEMDFKIAELLMEERSAL